MAPRYKLKIILIADIESGSVSPYHFRRCPVRQRLNRERGIESAWIYTFGTLWIRPLRSVTDEAGSFPMRQLPS